ncbi:MAG: single-stranded DNA-binding protein [Flavobacteriales bacterium]|nr:single-stranded DNA-binding protein [Flavobacteriales bacterium]
MAGSINKVILVGNLGKDPEIKNFEGGGMVAQFSVATQESYFDREKNQRIDLPTDWHNVVIKSTGLAKVAQQYLHKGKQVYLEGKLKTRSYQTKEGETKYITEVVATDMVLLGSGAGSSSTQPQTAPEHNLPSSPPAHDSDGGTDDLPF